MGDALSLLDIEQRDALDGTEAGRQPARPAKARPATARSERSLSVRDRLTFNGAIIETGTDSYRLAGTRARVKEPA